MSFYGTENSALDQFAESKAIVSMIHGENSGGGCDLSLVIVVNEDGGSSTGNLAIEISGDKSNPDLIDDDGEVGSFSGGKTSFSWAWAACCTDGMVDMLPELSEWDGSITIEETSSTNVDNWRFVEGDESKESLDTWSTLEIRRVANGC